MKVIKISKAIRDAHNQKHGKTPEQVAEYREAQAIKKYGEDKYKRMLRKQDVRSILVEKGTRPKGKFYNPEPRLNPLEKLFHKDIESIESIDGSTQEGQDEVRMMFFGSKLE